MFYKKVTRQSEPCNAKSSRECWHFRCQNTNQLYESLQQLKVRKNKKRISVRVKVYFANECTESVLQSYTFDDTPKIIELNLQQCILV